MKTGGVKTVNLSDVPSKRVDKTASMLSGSIVAYTVPPSIVSSTVVLEIA